MSNQHQQLLLLVFSGYCALACILLHCAAHPGAKFYQAGFYRRGQFKMLMAKLKRGISNIRKIITLHCSFSGNRQGSDLPVRDMGPFLQFSLNRINPKARPLNKQQRCN